MREYLRYWQTIWLVLTEGRNKPLLWRLSIWCATFFFVFALLGADFAVDSMSFRPGDVSDRDVLAPRSVSYVDVVKTKRLESDVLNSVPTVYDLDGEVLRKTERRVTEIFDAARLALREVDVSKREELLSSMATASLPKEFLTRLARADAEQLEQGEQVTKQALRQILQRGVREEEVEAVRKQLSSETALLTDNTAAASLANETAQLLVAPNFFQNAKETERRRQQALGSIDPVRETIKKGQMLVRRGDVITPEHIQAMRESGLYHDTDMRKGQLAGLAIFAALILGLGTFFLYKFIPTVYQDHKRMLLLSLIVTGTLFLGKLAHLYSDYAAPLAAGVLLSTVLLGAKTGFMISVALGSLFGVISGFDLRPVLMIILGSWMGVFTLSRIDHGYSLPRTGIWIALVQALTVLAIGLLDDLAPSYIGMQTVIAVMNGIASAVITIGLLPYLEQTFSITTPIKLLDFSRPNHPLLQRLLFEAPGTYHHSVLVGNLAEMAAERVGADPLLVRVGAYYHDVGKIKRPCFFSENQVAGENPHDKLAPSLSTLIVTSHIRDGVELCREYGLPQAIIELIEQHHGSMLVSYFYQRACSEEHGECLAEEDFRYEGPKPQSKEAALLMLADACEASVRSLGKPNQNRIEMMVRKMIKERLHDGQLDECPLAFRDLEAIGDVFVRVLSSMFYTRIEYPDNLRELERRKGKNGNSLKQPAGKDGSDSGDGGHGEESAAESGRTLRAQ